MGALTRGFVLAQIVGRNAVPVIGILFSGWPAGNVMLLYFFDTLLSLGVVGAGLGKSPVKLLSASNLGGSAPFT